MKSEGASSARSGLDDDFGTNINGDAQDDMASDVQEGAQSTVGSLVQRNGVVCALHSAYSTPPDMMLNFSIMNPGRTMNLVPTTSPTDRRSETLVRCPLRAFLAGSVLFYPDVSPYDDVLILPS
jgi:hypothetical protein